MHLVVARRQHPDGFPSPVAPSHGPSVGDWYIGLTPQEVRAAVREAMRLNVRWAHGELDARTGTAWRRR